MTDIYRYKSLDNQDSIRVLELLPGQHSENLECRLLEVRRIDKPRYEALSYTWGAMEFTHQVAITGSNSNISITENLFNALHALRSVTQCRQLWIDAICINQKDDAEKGTQVAQMGQTYAHATKVLVWLGKNDCVKAMTELEAISKNCELYGLSSVFPFSRRTHDQAALENLKRLAETCDGAALHTFLSSSWFNRVWIVQEFVLASDLVILSGRSSIDYFSVSMAFAVLRLIRRRPIIWSACLTTSLVQVFENHNFWVIWDLIQTRERHIARLRQDSINTDPSTREVDMHDKSLIEYCVQMSTRDCHDERDRVYGVLGFAQDNMSLKPDYSKSAGEVFQDLAILTLRSGDLTVLHYAGMPFDRELKGPSFVADFSKLNYDSNRLGGHGHPRFHASPQPNGYVQLIKGKIPVLNAKVLGRVKDQLTVQREPRPEGSSEGSTIKYNETALRVANADIVPMGKLDSDTLLQVYEICKDWMDTIVTEYDPVNFSRVFAQAILADNALDSTRSLIGDMHDAESLEKLCVMYSLAKCIEPESDLHVIADKLFARCIGGDGHVVELGFRTFDTDEPVVYVFPSPNAFTVSLESGEMSFVTLSGPLKEHL